MSKTPTPAFYATITFTAEDCEVFGTMHRGYPGSSETPKETAYFEVDRIMFNGIDILPLFSDKQLDQLQITAAEEFTPSSLAH